MIRGVFFFFGGRASPSIIRGSQSKGEHREDAGEGVAKYFLSAGRCDRQSLFCLSELPRWPLAVDGPDSRKKQLKLLSESTIPVS